MLEILPRNLNFDFVGRRYFFLALSFVAVLATVILLATKGLNYGIDFSGGAEVQIKLKNEVETSVLRGYLDKGGFENLVLQQLGDPAQREYLVKFKSENDSVIQAAGKKMESVLGAHFASGEFEVQRVDVVGPQAGKELRKSGFLSIFYTLVCILVYVVFRFDLRYGPGAIAALFHDAMITLGIFVLTQKEFSLQIVAAILTIIGYSNNDTIIVFDRVRETLRAHPGRSLEDNINRSINETLSRTILTSVCTLLVVVALMIFGGSVIHDFAFTMCVGILVGTYSSVFIASPTVIFLTHWQEGRRKNGSQQRV